MGGQGSSDWFVLVKQIETYHCIIHLTVKTAYDLPTENGFRRPPWD